MVVSPLPPTLMLTKDSDGFVVDSGSESASPTTPMPTDLSPTDSVSSASARALSATSTPSAAGAAAGAAAPAKVFSVAPKPPAGAASAAAAAAAGAAAAEPESPTDRLLAMDSAEFCDFMEPFFAAAGIGGRAPVAVRPAPIAARAMRAAPYSPLSIGSTPRALGSTRSMTALDTVADHWLGRPTQTLDDIVVYKKRQPLFLDTP